MAMQAIRAWHPALTLSLRQPTLQAWWCEGGLGCQPAKGPHSLHCKSWFSGPGRGAHGPSGRCREHGSQRSTLQSLTIQFCKILINHILALIVGPIDFHFLPPPCFWVFIFIISPFQSEVNNYFQLEKNYSNKKAPSRKAGGPLTKPLSSSGRSIPLASPP
jgi:hypothetical protein